MIGGEKRGLKCPPHEPLLLYAGHRRAGGGGRGTCVFTGLVKVFTAPLKKFCGPAAFAGSVRARFFAPTRILAVILRGLLELL